MSDRPTLRTDHAALALGAALLLLLVTSPAAVALDLYGILLVQLVAFGGPPALIAYFISGSIAGALRRLGVSRPSNRALAGTTLLGISFWYVSLWLIVPLGLRLFGGEAELARMQETFFASGLPVVVVVAIVAIPPALCEELLYRGAITRAIHRAHGPVLAVIISALVFGVLHIQPARMIPAASFGLVLGYAAVVSGSIVPGMWMHFLNNAIAVTLASGTFPSVTRALEQHPNGIGAAALGLSMVGVWLLWSGRKPAGNH
jgi:membrane protease YdiL (CAAX protease family)